MVVFVLGFGYGLLGIMPSAPAQLVSIAIFVILRPLMYTFSASTMLPPSPFPVHALPRANSQSQTKFRFFFLTRLLHLGFRIVGDYTGKAFGFETFGTVYGLLNCTAGIFGLVLRPIDLLVKGPLRGNYTVVNVVGLILGCVSTVLITWRIYRSPTAAGQIALLEEGEDDEMSD